MKRTKTSHTCIAVIKNSKGKLLMAGERRSSWDFSQAQDMPKPKVVAIYNGKRKDKKGNYLTKGQVLLGATGDGWLCTLFTEIMPMLRVTKKTDVDSYVYQTMWATMYEMLKHRGYAEEHGLLKIPTDSYCELVIGIKGRVFQAVVHNPEDPSNNQPNGLITMDELNVLYATGCGGSQSWGCGDGISASDIYIKDHKQFRKLTDREILHRMISTANKYSPGCGGSIDIIEEL